MNERRRQVAVVLVPQRKTLRKVWWLTILGDMLKVIIIMMTHNQRAMKWWATFIFVGIFEILVWLRQQPMRCFTFLRCQVACSVFLIKYKINVVVTNADDDSSCENLCTNQTSTNGSWFINTQNFPFFVIAIVLLELTYFVIWLNS